MASEESLDCKELVAAIEEVPLEASSADAAADTYSDTINTILEVAKAISVQRSSADGRIDSAVKEGPFLESLKEKLLELEPSWTIIISPPRASCDIMINNIRINLKLTDCKSADNSANKPAIYYSITGLTTYPYSSTWNDFLEHLNVAAAANQIKKVRCELTEYHYLVKNKITGDVLLKPIFDIHTYISNPSNDLQINWKNEFENMSYATADADYIKKVESLLTCLQKSVQAMIERTKKFAEADINGLLNPKAPEEAEPKAPEEAEPKAPEE
jgi:hypothetical protein